ncbi:hypothetical protein VH22019_00035 [Vibrio phage VH2_2019]|nr:hypothetical protein VH22019_00035 [Vibrio phage VH2_2019]
MMTNAQWEERKAQLLARHNEKQLAKKSDKVDVTQWQPATRIKPDLAADTKIEVYLSGYPVTRTLGEISQEVWQLAATKWRVSP